MEARDMHSKIMDGKSLSEQILGRLKTEIAGAALSRPPKLVVFQVGDDYASTQYVQMKKKVAHRIGAELEICTFGGNGDNRAVVGKICSVCADENVDGVMVQLPLPEGYDSELILDSIQVEKDLDGLTSLNLGLLMASSQKAIPPATISGVMKLLSHYRVELKGKRGVIIGKGRAVGLPLFAKLNSVGVTLTMCDIHTVDLKAACRDADLVVSAAGVKHLVGPEHIKEGAILVDIGVSRDPVTEKIAGDIDFDAVYEKCSLITPVPGGVGPMTIASLMENLVNAWLLNAKR